MKLSPTSTKRAHDGVARSDPLAPAIGEESKEIYTNQTTPPNHFEIKTNPTEAHDRTEAQARLPPVFLNTAGGPPQMGSGLYRRPRPAGCVPRNECVKECAPQW